MEIFIGTILKKAKVGIMRECVLGSSWDLSLVPVPKLCRLFEEGLLKTKEF